VQRMLAQEQERGLQLKQELKQLRCQEEADCLLKACGGLAELALEHLKRQMADGKPGTMPVADLSDRWELLATSHHQEFAKVAELAAAEEVSPTAVKEDAVPVAMQTSQVEPQILCQLVDALLARGDVGNSEEIAESSLSGPVMNALLERRRAVRVQARLSELAHCASREEEVRRNFLQQLASAREAQAASDDALAAVREDAFKVRSELAGARLQRAAALEAGLSGECDISRSSWRSFGSDREVGSEAFAEALRSHAEALKDSLHASIDAALKAGRAKGTKQAIHQMTAETGSAATALHGGA